MADIPKTLKRRFQIVVKALDIQKPVKLRELRSEGLRIASILKWNFVSFIVCLSIDIGHMVTIIGLFTKSSDVKPRIKVCTYACDVCGSEIFQDVVVL